MHAVVVDPSRVVLKLVSELISERGDAVTEFQDSASALRTIKTDPSVDILITSMEVQPMTGLELCWEARLAVPNRQPLYIIVMSTLNDDSKLAEALDSGADDLIAKPVKRLELHARLRMAGRLKSAQLHLVQLADTDGLTGALNRRAFFERLEGLIRGRPRNDPLVAVLLDIDHFKRVNDSYGHDVGDEVIKRVAAEAAKHGTLGRLGGEEFALVLEGDDALRAPKVMDVLRRNCAKLTFNGSGDPFSVTCSFGIGNWRDGDTADGLLKRADVALYSAKTSGRNRVHSDQVAAPIEADAHSVARRRARSGRGKR